MNKNCILITGASSSIGGAIIRKIADDSTVILAHCHSGLEKLNALKTEVPGKLVPIQADLREESGILALADGVGSHCEAPGKIVFLAAPRLSLARFKSLSWEDFELHHRMPLRTAVTLLGRFLPKMAKSGGGRVVFMLSSVTVGVPPAGMAHYVTAKYALLGLMKALASEYAAKGVTLNAIAPSMME